VEGQKVKKSSKSHIEEGKATEPVKGKKNGKPDKMAKKS
jgi:hypothetical protein